jgi:hypothetical protein
MMENLSGKMRNLRPVAAPSFQNGQTADPPAPAAKAPPALGMTIQ